MGIPVLETSTGRCCDAVLCKSNTPADALTQAATLSHRGLSGHLATLTCSADNQKMPNLLKTLASAAQKASSRQKTWRGCSNTLGHQP